jgi:hypothetical protein
MRRRPEGNEKAEEEGMRDYLVEPGHLKLRRLELFALEVSVHLPHPKQLEVIDEERRNENESPPYCVEFLDGVDTGRALDTPDLEFDRSPLPEQDDEQNVGEEHVRAALGCFGDDVPPQSLNPCRAIALCWTANTPSSATSIPTAVQNGVSPAEVSIPCGMKHKNAKSPTNAMAYSRTPKNIT